MIAAFCISGSLIAFGLFLVLRGVIGVRAPEGEPLMPERPPRKPLNESFDRFWLRITLALVGAIVLFVATGWVVGLVIAGVFGFLAPSLVGAKARRGATQARLEAIATWTEQLRDVMAAASGLEQAIVSTAPLAPAPIRRDVGWLAATLEAGTGMRTAMRRFSERLDDATGDLVVAALILAAEGSPRHLGELLGRLASTTRAQVRMRQRVEVGRMRTRTSVQVVTAVTIGLSFVLVVANRQYVEAYRTLPGQLMLVIVSLFYAGSYLWIARASRPRKAERFLAMGNAPTAAVDQQHALRDRAAHLAGASPRLANGAPR